MIKRNEEMENELIRYKKKVEQLEKHLAMLEGKSPSQKIGGGARPAPKVPNDDPMDGY